MASKCCRHIIIDIETEKNYNIHHINAGIA